MRLFIAINLNSNTKDGLLALRDELRSGAERGNFSLPENLHLTLAFLDECDHKQAASAKAAMSAVRFEPFELLIERIGRFGGRGVKSPGPVGHPLFKEGMGGRDAGQDEALWWAGVRVNEPMEQLHRELNDNLIAAGFSLDTRKFSPHITLGRRVVSDAASRRVEPFGETVRHIDLMKSERIAGKLTYTAIFRK